MGRAERVQKPGPCTELVRHLVAFELDGGNERDLRFFFSSHQQSTTVNHDNLAGAITLLHKE